MSKIKERITPYLKGKIVDIGCGSSKITQDAIGVDGRDMKGVDVVLKNDDQIYNLELFYVKKLGDADLIFSSHCMEHLSNPYHAIWDWSHLIKSGGYLILYLPEASRYDSYENLEHMHNFNYKDFIFWFKRVWCGEGKNFKGENLRAVYSLIESGLDPDEEDLYSFYLVAQKL